MMENKSLVSVIIPVLNEESNIPQLFNSICKQDYRPIEVVIIDDGSTDKTLDIVDKILNNKTDNKLRLTVIRASEPGKPKGPSHARNVGLNAAKGEVITFLDADNRFVDVDFTRKIVKALDENLAVRYDSTIIVDNTFEHQLALDYNMHKLIPAGIAYRRDAIGDLKFNEKLGIGEDRIFVFDFLKNKNLSLNQILKVNVKTAIHLPHTYQEYIRQRLWQGKGNFILLSNRKSSIINSLTPTFPIICVGLSLTVMPLNYFLSAFLALIYFLMSVCFWLKSSEKNLLRFIHLVAIRFLLGSLTYTYGFAKGFLSFIYKGAVDPSRER